MSRATTYALILGGGGLTALGIWWLAARKSDALEQEITDIMNSANVPGGGPGPGKLNTVKLRLTGYWPFQSGLDATARKMEGGASDRKGKPLYTLEQHLADPARYPYVSLSGDDAIWPYGQRIAIDAWPGAVFRVVDTGSHFRGATKIYRVMGYEPIDVCVNSSATVVPKLVDGHIVVGDNFAGGALVASAKLKDQTVVVGADDDGSDRKG